MQQDIELAKFHQQELLLGLRRAQLAHSVAPLRRPWLRSFVMPSDKRSLLISVAYMGVGFSPIGALALTIGGLWPLWIGSLAMIVPAIGLALVLGRISPRHGRMAFEGFVAGLAAVLVYDMVRWDFVAFQLWGDFIPNIGGWLDGSGDPNWLLGYGFRWLGDGGGMGLTFMVAARTFAQPLARHSHWRSATACSSGCVCS